MPLRFIVLLFLGGFAFTLAATTVVQQLVAPERYAYAATTGFMSPDSFNNHVAASRMAADIGAEGWGAWSLRPNRQSPAGIAAAIYAIAGVRPWAVLWFNSAVHAGAFVLLALILHRLSGLGRWAAVPAALFLALPSSLQWTAGLLKDGVSILGLYSSVLGLLLLLEKPPARPARRWIGPGLLLFLGGIASWVARPYAVALTLAAMAAAVAVLALARVLRPLRLSAAAPAALAIVLLGAAGGAVLLDAAHARDLRDAPPGLPPESVVAECWVPSSWLPDPVERLFQAVAVSRATLYLKDGPGARSSFDAHRNPCSAGDVIRLAPRAMLHALLAPWPTQWRQLAPSELILVPLALEMTALYVGLALFVWFGGALSRLSLPVLALCLVYLAPFALTLPNVGTLTRMRYGPLLIIATLGFAALVKRMRASPSASR